MKVQFKRGLIIKGAELLEPTTVLERRKPVRAWVCRVQGEHLQIISEHNLRRRKGIRPPPLMAGRNRIYAGYRRRCQVRNIFFDLTAEEFGAIVTKPCAYCGCAPLGRETVSGFRYNGLDRKNNEKGYAKYNVVACCGPCNSIKGDVLTYREMVAAMKAILRVRKRKRR